MTNIFRFRKVDFKQGELNWKILALLITLMVLTACAKTTKNDYKFIGESEYAYRGTEVWGETNGKKTYSNEDSYEFVLKYKGALEELSSMKRIEYSYETNFSNGEVTEE